MLPCLHRIIHKVFMELHNLLVLFSNLRNEILYQGNNLSTSKQPIAAQFIIHTSKKIPASKDWQEYSLLTFASPHGQMS